jgi:transcription elongation factor GreA
MKKYFARKEPRIPFTEEGYRKLLEEKSRLHSERPAAVEHLRKAREMGDLSENGYYKASRARLSFLDARIRRVDRLVKLAVVVKSGGSGVVEIGSRIVVTDGKKERELTVVGGYESDPAQNTISHISPIGRALLGKKAGDRVEVHAPAGTLSYTVLKVF